MENEKNIQEIQEEDFGSLFHSDNSNEFESEPKQLNIEEVEEDSIGAFGQDIEDIKVVKAQQIVNEVDETVDTISDDYVENKRVQSKSTTKEVDETVDTVPDDYVEYQKISKETGLTEQIEEDLGNENLGSAEEYARQVEKDKLVDEEAEIRAEEKATRIVNQTIRSATEVLNEQNLLATKEAEQNIRERQYRLEQKIKRNKHRDIRGKIGTSIFMACLIVGLYICYSNPTLNKGIRAVLSSTLNMFSDLIAGKEVDSNDVVNNLGDTLNNNTMKYEYHLVDEYGNELQEEETGFEEEENEEDD